MDRDENDLLATNVFIPKPELENEVPKDGIDEFKSFYLKNLELENQAKIIDEIKNIKIGDDPGAQDHDLLNTNAVNFSKIVQQPMESRKTKEVKTFVNIDSRDRDKKLYKKPNSFKIFLSKTFYNVKSIKLASIEFPNTDAVINDRNKFIYWRNLEDIDDELPDNRSLVTINKQITYPIYTASLRVGRYTVSSLQAEIVNKMNKVKRKNGSGDFHYFVVTLDLSTDIVTFIGLNLMDLANNPLTVSSGNNIVTVSAPGHGYSEDEVIYIIGATSVGGIPAANINGFKTVIPPIDNNTFRFEVNINANTTGTGGGASVKIGKQAPFQLLWGGHTTSSNTFAQNLGFPLEDSSKRIYTEINKLENIYQMIITTKTPHLLTNDSVNSYLELGKVEVGGVFDIDTTYTTKLITSIPSVNTILVQVTNDQVTRDIIKDKDKNGTRLNSIRFNSTIFSVESYKVYTTRSFMLTTNVDHRYELGDVGKNINLYNTQNLNDFDDTTNYDGTYIISQRLNSTQLILPGIISEEDSESKENCGYIPRHTPFKTWTVPIERISQGTESGYSAIKCKIEHKLKVNDTIRLVNVNTSPSLSKNNIFSISHIQDELTFEIDKSFVDSSVNGSSFVSTGLIEVSFPNHKFNTIEDIEIDGLSATIRTTISHGLETEDNIRIMETNTSPSIDGWYSVTKEDDDEFTITVPSSISLPPVGTKITGIIGMSNTFNLYGVEDISNISGDILNGSGFTVREVIDENTFTFYVPNSFADSSIRGGGDNIYISSNLHGYSGVQTNTKDDILNRSINLEGENYCFLTCPQLDTMKNTGSVKNIFARVSLDQAPGYICFNYLSNPKDFDKVPLNVLGDLEFSCVNYDGSLYDFNDLDYSFVLEIIEVIDDSNTFNISSRRGIKYT